MASSKEIIVNIAAKLFMQKGFREVTMQDIVKETGLSKGAIYHYFASKEAVLKEIINYYFSESLYGVIPLDNDDTLRSYVESYIKRIWRRLEQFKAIGGAEDKILPVNQYVLIFDAMRIFPDFQAQQKHLQKKELDAWMVIVDRAKKTGEISSPHTSEIIAKQFIYLSFGIGVLQVIRNAGDFMKNEIKIQFEAMYQSLKNTQ